MRTSNRTAFIVTYVVASFAVTLWTAAAQPAPPPPTAAAPADHADMRAKLMAMDIDKNGEWSKAEWLAGGRKQVGFEMMDTDKNGSLTMAELRAGKERMQTMRARR